MNEQELREALADAKPDPEATELHKLMVDKLYAVPPSQRRTAWWVMSKAFHDNLRAKFGGGGDPYSVLGKRVVIDDEAAEPRLESCPVDWVTRERTRISQAALKAAEDGIISMPELMAAIWKD